MRQRKLRSISITWALSVFIGYQVSRIEMETSGSTSTCLLQMAIGPYFACPLGREVQSTKASKAYLSRVAWDNLSERRVHSTRNGIYAPCQQETTWKIKVITCLQQSWASYQSGTKGGKSLQLQPPLQNPDKRREKGILGPFIDILPPAAQMQKE